MSDLKESHEERMSSLNQSHATEITQLTNQKEENKKELTAAYQDKLESVQNILETAKVDRDHLSSLNKELEEKVGWRGVDVRLTEFTNVQTHGRLLTNSMPRKCIVLAKYSHRRKMRP